MEEGIRFRADLLAAAVLASTCAMAGSLAFAAPLYAPDLAVEIRIEPVTPLVGETIRVELKVENRGRTAAGPSTLVVKVEGDPERREFELGALPGGQDARFGFELEFAIPGRFRITAEADAGGRVIETDETNNSTVASVLVLETLGVDRAAGS